MRRQPTRVPCPWCPDFKPDESDRPPTASHGICEPCKALIDATLDELEAPAATRLVRSSS